MSARRAALLAVMSLAAGLVAVVPATTGDASPPQPGLRLITTEHHVDVVRFEGDPGLYLPPTVYIASTHGPFEIDVIRRGGDVNLWLVRRTPEGVERLRTIDPPARVRPDRGLSDFFRFRLIDAGGDVVARQLQDFCPVADYGMSRVDASGPDNPTYPYYCGSRLTRKTAWGIDRGWASPVYGGLVVSPKDAPDGDYTLQVRIAHSYVRQLRLDPEQTTASVGVTITTETYPTCGDEVPCCSPDEPCPVLRPAAAQRTPLRMLRQASAAASFVPQNGLPDLAALPAHTLFMQRESNRDYLAFGATIWNAGPGMLDVEGFRRGHNEMRAVQFVYRNDRVVAKERIGHFEFDEREGHHHWHLADFARYDLLSIDGEHLVRSRKQSFCLAPTDPINLLGEGALWHPERVGLSSACPTEQSIWLRETMPPGWGDTYVQAAAGQSFNITGLDNGKYLLRVRTNPFGRILETTRANDTSWLKLRLGGTDGARTVESLGVVHR
jgi:hypothetical protein